MNTFFGISVVRAAWARPFRIPGFWEYINLPPGCDVSDGRFRIPAVVAPKKPP